jgi:hypothetical protein
MRRASFDLHKQRQSATAGVGENLKLRSGEFLELGRGGGAHSTRRTPTICNNLQATGLLKLNFVMAFCK